MNDCFSFEKKDNDLFSRYWDFFVFDNSTEFKTFDVIIDITAHKKLHLQLFLKNLW